MAVPSVILALLSAACNAAGSPLPNQLLPTNPPPVPLTAPASLRLGACQSRLFGKVINATTHQSPPNVTIEITAGSLKAKTVTDANGLYGFAGLCAGNYNMAITLPGGKPMVASSPITLDGTEPVKQDLSFK